MPPCVLRGWGDLSFMGVNPHHFPAYSGTNYSTLGTQCQQFTKRQRKSCSHAELVTPTPPQGQIRGGSAMQQHRETEEHQSPSPKTSVSGSGTQHT